jgi:hypothetical protein
MKALPISVSFIVYIFSFTYFTLRIIALLYLELLERL